MQLRWIAPTPVFVELGAELGSGRAFPSTDRNKNGADTAAALAHVGGDIGESYAWRAGVSYLRTSAADRAYADIDSLGNPVNNSFTGRTRAWIADAVFKWAPNGNATRTNFKLQAEYFRVKESGTLAYDDAGAVFGTLTDSFGTAQSGWYAQGVYQFMPRWRVGYRYDALRSGTPAIGIVSERPGSDAGRFPDARQSQPEPQHGDGRLEPERVQPSAAAVCRGQVARGRDGSPDHPAVHPQSRRARRSQVLRRTR